MPLPVGWEEGLGCGEGGGPPGAWAHGSAYQYSRGSTWYRWSEVLGWPVSVNVSVSSAPTLSGTPSLFRNSVL